MTETGPDLVVRGRQVPAGLVGLLKDDSADRRDGEKMRRCLEEDGYLLLRGVIDPGHVLSAREAILERLAAVEEIKDPARDGIASGRSARARRAGNLNAFWRSVSEEPRLRRVSHGAELDNLMASIFRQPAKAFDFVWLRPTAPGRASPLHFDHVYMNRGSANVITAWLPLGPVGAEDGPIVIVKDSHHFDDLIDRYRGIDVDADSMAGSLPEDAMTFAQRRGAPLLTSDFEPGDVLLFGMFTLHGSADNVSPIDRVRLSCDVRYQPAAEAQDARWFGSPPPGHGGKSYGGLNAAQPLTAEPVAR